MKKLKATLILLGLGLVLSIGVMAQGPPPPPSDPNANGNQGPSNGPPTNGAPIGSGTIIFLILAGGYGLTKVYQLKKAHSIS